MRGVITTRDVVKHFGLIYREFGMGCALRCIWVVATGKTTTFLDVVLPHHPAAVTDEVTRAQ